jgi:hypothetical protein
MGTKKKLVLKKKTIAHLAQADMIVVQAGKDVTGCIYTACCKSEIKTACCG